MEDGKGIAVTTNPGSTHSVREGEAPRALLVEGAT